MKKDWQIYYDDKKPFSNLDGTPEQAPAWGVIDIMQYDTARDGRGYHQGGSDYYIWREVDQKWVGVDFCGLVDFMINEIDLMKVGRTIDTKKYLEIRKQAGEDFGREV